MAPSDRSGTGMEDSLGGATSYVWDAENRLTDLTSPRVSTYSFGYDDEGRHTALTSTSGRATAYGYTNGLLSALTHAQSGVTLADLEYTYDPVAIALLDCVDGLGLIAEGVVVVIGRNSAG